MELADAVSEFLIAGRQCGWSHRTLGTYGWNLEHMLLWLADHDIHLVEQLDSRPIRRWGAAITEGRQAATVKGAVTTARSFLRWLRAEGLIETDLVQALKVPPVPKKIQRTVTQDEVQALLLTCEQPVERGLTAEQALATAARNAAIVSLLYDSLIRASELCAVRCDQVDLDAGSLLVESGKGGDDRHAYFGIDTVVALRAWLDVRPNVPGVPWLFVSIWGSTPGCQLTTRGLRIILKNLGERAGVDAISPHAFRRGGAAAVTLAGMPSRMVQLLGGWSNIRMVELYTRALLANNETVKMFRRFSPVTAAKKGRRGRQYT